MIKINNSTFNIVINVNKDNQLIDKKSITKIINNELNKKLAGLENNLLESNKNSNQLMIDDKQNNNTCKYFSKK